MLSSMTGFARQTAQFAWGTMTCEIRSVNHRYLEFSARLPEFLRSMEYELRTIAQQQIKRGKMEAGIKVQLSEQPSQGLEFNHHAIEQLLHVYQHYSEKVPNASLDFAKLLTWPPSLTTVETDLSFINPHLRTLFNKTLMQFKQTRQAEGQAIAGFLQEKCVAMSQQVELAKAQLPKVINQTRSKLLACFAELQQTLDPMRLEQEMVMIAQKLDVAEELERLQLHLAQIKALLVKGEQAGRRLDFLMQELNREANTLGSKAADYTMTQVSVEIKVLIEQMREQIQNVE